MSEDVGKLTVVGLEIPKGENAQGTKVKLSNGQYLAGIQSITLHADMNNTNWQLSITVRPEFVDQMNIEALLVDAELVQQQSAPQRMHSIENQISNLQTELDWLKEHGKAQESTA